MRRTPKDVCSGSSYSVFVDVLFKVEESIAFYKSCDPVQWWSCHKSGGGGNAPRWQACVVSLALWRPFEASRGCMKLEILFKKHPKMFESFCRVAGHCVKPYRQVSGGWLQPGVVVAACGPGPWAANGP